MKTDLDLHGLKERCMYAVANGFLVARADEYAKALGGEGGDVSAAELLALVDAALAGEGKKAKKAEGKADSKAAKKAEKKAAEAKAAEEAPKAEEPKAEEPKADAAPAAEEAPKAEEKAVDASPEDPFKDF